jgi:hypothetical protein
MELYRRIRMLRLSSASVKQGMYDDDAVLSGSRRAGNRLSSVTRSNNKEKDFEHDPSFIIESGGGSADAIDSKYHRLYEEKLDPFKFEEMDRITVLSRYNFIERSLAYGVRQFFQDRWARHAIIVYLALVHFFAFAYVVKVLNPQLVDEVDAHLKLNWEKETMEQVMEREHPDVRIRW